MSQRIDIEKVLLQELMEDSPDYIFIKDRVSRFVITNKAHAQRLLGLDDPADAAGKTDFDLFPEKAADAQRFYDEEQSIMANGQPVLRREWMVPSTTTGEPVWLSESKLPIRNESGEVIGIFGIGRDITERKKAQFLTEKLSHQLETAVKVAHIANDVLDPQELTQLIVNLVREQFDFYYVGLFFVDQTLTLYSRPGEYAVLRAATGEAGQELINRNHKLKVGGESMVGQCIATGKSRFVQQGIEKAGNRFANPLLPSTRSELVLPLVSRRETIGALDIQSTKETAFSEQDVSVFEVLAALLATSIQNAFLFQKLESELDAAKKNLDTNVLTGWNKFLEKK